MTHVAVLSYLPLCLLVICFIYVLSILYSYVTRDRHLFLIKYEYVMLVSLIKKDHVFMYLIYMSVEKQNWRLLLKRLEVGNIIRDCT